MADAPAPPSNYGSSLLNPPKTPYKDPDPAPPPLLRPRGWKSNGAIGRVKTGECYEDGREIHQENRKKYLQDQLNQYQQLQNPNIQQSSQAITDRNELNGIYADQNPGQSVMREPSSSGEQAEYAGRQAQATHIDDMENDLFWQVPEAGAALGATPKQVHVLHKQVTELGNAMSNVHDELPTGGLEVDHVCTTNDPQCGY